MKRVEDPNKRLQIIDEDEEENSNDMAFYEQLNFEITEGIYNWSKEFIYTMMEIDCDARDLAIRIIKSKRRKGTAFKSDESLSEDEDSDDGERNGGHCHEDDCGSCANTNGSFKGEKFNREAYAESKGKNIFEEDKEVEITQIQGDDEKIDLLG